jgi:hypothetical protein
LIARPEMKINNSCLSFDLCWKHTKAWLLESRANQ